MSESTPNTTPNAAGTSAAGSPPQLRVLAQYLKDHSFENPKAPASFQASEPPAMEVNVDVNARALGEHQYEVELTVSAKAKRTEEIVFVIDTTYAGAFEIMNVPKEQIEPVLLVECPRLLFPFIRQIIADTVSSGNFPPLMLEPIDFLAIYQQRMLQAQAQQGGEQAPAHA